MFRSSLRIRSGWVFLLGGVAFLAACSGGTADDDDDVVTSPPPPSITTTTGTPTGTPSPSPTPTSVPYIPERCFLRWTTVSGTRTHTYMLDMPASKWISGTGTYGAPDVQAFFVYGSTDGTFAGAEAVTLPTSGTFTLVVTSLQDGNSINFDDGVAQGYNSFDFVNQTSGAQAASGGTGTFTGVWSNHLATAEAGLTPGSGTLTVAIATSSLTLGQTTSVGQCYDAR